MQKHEEGRAARASRAEAVARPIGRTPRGVTGGRARAARRDLHRAGVSARSPRRTWSRPRARRPMPVRHADRLRLRLRGRMSARRLSQASAACRAQGADEPRPAHGRRAEEDRGGQPVRGVRRAGHRDARRPNAARSEVEINGVDVFDPTTGEVRSRRAPRTSPAGSSTPTTTRRASSSATPISSAATTRTRS